MGVAKDNVEIEAEVMALRTLVLALCSYHSDTAVLRDRFREIYAPQVHALIGQNGERSAALAKSLLDACDRLNADISRPGTT